MYWRLGMRFALWFSEAARRRFGTDGGVREDYTRKLTGYWDVYMQGPDWNYANFNDMNENCFTGLYGRDRYPEGGPNAMLAALFESWVPGGDPLLLWASDNGGGSGREGGVLPFYLIWRRDAPLAGKRPKLQDSVLFRGAGHAVWRSPKLWFVLNGGWTSNGGHYNKDLAPYGYPDFET